MTDKRFGKIRKAVEGAKTKEELKQKLQESWNFAIQPRYARMNHGHAIYINAHGEKHETSGPIDGDEVDLELERADMCKRMFFDDPHSTLWRNCQNLVLQLIGENNPDMYPGALEYHRLFNDVLRAAVDNGTDVREFLKIRQQENQK